LVCIFQNLVQLRQPSLFLDDVGLIVIKRVSQNVAKFSWWDVQRFRRFLLRITESNRVLQWFTELYLVSPGSIESYLGPTLLQVAVRQRLAEDAADVLNENIQLLDTADAPHFGRDVLVAPQRLAGPDHRVPIQKNGENIDR